MNIRKPLVNEIPLLVTLWEKQYEYHHNLDSDYYVDNSPSLTEQFKEHLAKAINDNDPYILCAYINDVMVGFVTFKKTEADYFDANITEYGEIIELHVEESSRRQGVGAALMKAVENFFSKEGLVWVELQASTYNKLAIKFYEGEGYKNRQTLMFKKIRN